MHYYLKSIKLIWGLCLIYPAYSQNITFRHTYGGTSQDNGKSVIQTKNSNYVIAGSTGSFGTNNADVYLFKTDSLGNIIWSKIIGGSNLEGANDIIEANDSTYFLCGYTNSKGAGGYDGYLIRTDSAGNKTWETTVGGNDWDFLYSLTKTSDGNYAAVGETYSFGGGNNDGLLVKFNDTDTLWTKWFGGANNEILRSVINTLDGGLMLLGETSSYGAGMRDVWLIKTNINGDTIWTKTFGGIKDDWGNAVIQTADSGFAIAGATYSFNNGDKDYYIIRTDKNGNMLWYQNYGLSGDDEAMDIVERQNGNLTFVGNTRSIGSGENEIHLVKVNSGGWFIDGPSFGSYNDDIASGLIQTNDASYAIIGSTENFSMGMYDVFFIKTDSLGYTNNFDVDTIHDPMSINNFIIQNKYIIYPNPVVSGNKINIIQNDKRFNTSDRIEIFDIYGRLLLNIKENQSIINLPTGIYYAKSDNMIIGKFIVTE
jgi:hypothetical protein